MLFMRLEKFEDAAGAYKKVAENYSQSEYGDDSQYWLAWSYYSLENFKKAQVWFGGLTTKYAKSPLCPGSPVPDWRVPSEQR